MAVQSPSEAEGSGPTVDEQAVLESLPAELATRVRALLRDRDHILALHEALLEIERAQSLDDRLRIFVHAVRSIGYRRVGIVIREGDHEGPRCIAVGMEEHEVFDLADVRHGGAEWGAGGTYVLPLRSPRGHPVATLVLGEAADPGPAAQARLRTIELFAQQVVHHIDQVRLAEFAARQAERLQRLQQVGTAVARSLDENEIALEVARGVSQLIECDSVVVVQPDLERGEVTPLVRLVAGEELTPPPEPLGDGVIARVVRTGQPVLVAEPHPAASALIGADALVVGAGAPVGSLLAVPLRVGLRLAAVLAVASRRRDAFADDDADLLLTMGAQAASALSNARLYAESQRERRQIEALADVARAVSESLRMGEVMRLILRHAMSLLGAEGACVALRRDDYLHIVAAAGTGDVLAGVHLPVRASISGRAVRDHTPVISNDVAGEPDVSRQVQRLVRISKMVVVPLSTARGVIGVLSVFNRTADFAEADARVLQRLADHVAVAIVNARLYEEVTEATREWTVAFNSIATGMVVLDEEGRIVRYNARALQLADFEKQRELVGRRFYDAIFHEAGPEGERCPVTRALRDGVAARETLRSATRGKLYDVVASPHPNGGAVVTFEDVTAIRSLAERNRLVLETASDAILLVDPAGNISFANPAAREMFGRAEELAGAQLASLVLPELAEELTSHAAATLAGQARRYDTVVVRGDGVRRFVSVSQAPLREMDLVTGMVLALRDNTDERERLVALARSEARFADLVESASDAIFTVDGSGHFTSVNRALEQATGKVRSDLLGKHFSVVVDPRDHDDMRHVLAGALEGRRQRRELRYLDANGVARPGVMLASPVAEGGGAITGALGIVRDVGEEKLRVEQLVQQEKLAAIGQLVSGVAHELNNPLASVMALSQLLLESHADRGEPGETLRTIHQEARRAAKIVANLLTFAREHPPERTTTSVNDVLVSTLELRRYALAVHGVELEEQLDPDLPTIWADPFQLQQVFLNLLANAEQALRGWAGERRITVSTALRGDRIVVTVRDTGPGVPDDDVPRIFNPFYTTKPVGKGTGLGLSVSDGIVREHGGSIRLETERDRGAAFIVELPAGASPGVPGDAPTAPASVPAGLASRRILVVDDEPAIRSAIVRYFAGLGHTVDAAATGAEALGLLGARRYDVVLLDLRMPELGGDEVYAELVARDPEHAARVVFLTGDVQSDVAREFLDRSGRPSVTKPFGFDELTRVVLGGEAAR